MAKKHGLAELAIADSAGEEWQAEASKRWAAAEEKAESERARAKSDRKREAISPMQFYEPAPLPEWQASEAVQGEVLGRFLFQPGTKLVHDVTAAVPACRVDEELPRIFIHFAAELEANTPDETRPCPACMGD